MDISYSDIVQNEFYILPILKRKVSYLFTLKIIFMKIGILLMKIN